jgi:hypothetical protein
VCSLIISLSTSFILLNHCGRKSCTPRQNISTSLKCQIEDVTCNRSSGIVSACHQGDGSYGEITYLTLLIRKQIETGFDTAFVGRCCLCRCCLCRCCLCRCCLCRCCLCRCCLCRCCLCRCCLCRCCLCRSCLCR